HRMNLDDVADDEFHSCKTDPVGWQPPPTKRRRRIGHIEHHFGVRPRRVVEHEIADLEWNCAIVNVTFLALGTRDGNGMAILQYRCCVAGADNCRQAELAANNRGVRGASTMVRDDRCGAFHDRHPVRIGGRRYQDCALLELSDLRRAFELANLPRRDSLANAEAGYQPSPLSLERVRLDRCGFPA